MKISNTKNNIASVTLTIFTLLTSCVTNAATKVTTADEVKWGYLNPLRGDKSPGAADLWGDRTKDTATGMLVRFKKGFESPPHIHNISYRGIVIDGLMHNDDPTAAKMWMPTGSFWTQPAGEDHTTAAHSTDNLIYLEIESGPYLVKSSTFQFDNGERPINLHKNNLVWLHNSDLAKIHSSDVQVAYLWGDTTATFGSMLKLPANFSGTITTKASEFKAVVIEGQVEFKMQNTLKNKTLKPASYIESDTNSMHQLTNSTSHDVIIYIRTNSVYVVN